MDTLIHNVVYKTGIAQQHEELGDMSRSHFYKRMTQPYILISLSDLSYWCMYMSFAFIILYEM